MKRKLIPAAIAAFAIAAAGGAYAGHGDEGDAALRAQAKISLVQAVAAAERHAKGKAVRAELENENGTAVYVVEVFDGAKANDVKVDARDGKVLSARADNDEHEDMDDEHEGENEHHGEHSAR